MARLGKLHNKLLLASEVRMCSVTSQYLFLVFFASPLAIQPDIFCPVQ